MGILQQPIEKKLTSLLGAEVTFENLKLSPLAGRLEATGMIIGSADPNQPLVRVRRIRAEVSVARALAGQLVIKSLEIEGASIQLVRRADGTLNLPRGEIAKSAPADSKAPNPADTMKPSSTPWQMEAQSIVFTGVQARFEDQSTGYVAVAEKIEVELRQHGNNFEFNLRAGVVSRSDRAAAVGPVQIAGEVFTAGGISQIASAGVEARLDFVDGLKVKAKVANLSEKRAAIEVRGPLDMEKVKSLLPAQIKLPEVVTAMQFNGPVNVDLKFDVDRAEGIHLREAQFAVNDVRIPIPNSVGKS